MLDLVALLIGFAVGTAVVVAVNGARRGSRPVPVVSRPVGRPAPAPPRPTPPAAPPAASGPPVLAKAPAPATERRSGPPRLELEDGSDGVDLDDQPVTLGRGNDQVLRVPDVRASRHHAVVRRRSKGRPGWELEDADSANGTFLNGHKIPDGRVAPLRDGDRIGIGDAVVVFRGSVGGPDGPGAGGADATRVIR